MKILDNNKFVLVHTVPQLIGVFDELCAKLLPSFRTMHVLDEPLLERVRQRGELTLEDAKQLQKNAEIAEDIGARAMLVTCSTISPCVDPIRTSVKIPIIKIDEAMITKAVEEGTQIGVIATNPTTLNPTREMLQAEATKANRKIETQLVFVEHAFEALMRQDVQTHDCLVKNAVLELGTQVDRIVLAQASTARVLNIFPEEERLVPILTSPLLALGQVQQILNGSRT